MNTRVRFVAVGFFIIAVGALPLFRGPAQSTAVVARSGESLRENASGAAQNDFQTFQKKAIAYALSKVKESEFELSPNESMKFADLHNKLSEPIEKRRKEFRDALVKTDPPNKMKVWDDFIRREDEAIYELFRFYLDEGDHCEARIYAGWIVDKELQKKAFREVYAVYVSNYETSLWIYKLIEKELLARTWTCKSLDGKTFKKLHFLSDGVRPESDFTAKRLYADRDKGLGWPIFPTVLLSFRLSDNPKGPWAASMRYDIRHCDRTNGDRLMEGLTFLTSPRYGTYDKILKTDGVGPALAHFADNLEIDATEYSLYVTNRVDAQPFFSLYRTYEGTFFTTTMKDFKRRCTSTPPVEESGGSRISLESSRCCAPDSPAMAAFRRIRP